MIMSFAFIGFGCSFMVWHFGHSRHLPSAGTASVYPQQVHFIGFFSIFSGRTLQPVTSAKGGIASQLQAERHRPALAEFRR